MTSSATTGRPARRSPSQIRLVASDLDGTLLDSHEQVSDRTVATIGRAVAAGLWVIAATGRQVTQLPPAVLTSGVTHAVGSNGAIAMDLTSGEVLFEAFLAPEAAADIVAYLTAEFEDVRFSAVRDRGRRHAAEPGYLDLLTPRELRYWAVEVEDLADIVAQPTLKLTARHPRLSADDLLGVLDASGLSGFHATTSGAPFLEIGGAGVTKATGVARLCGLLDVDATEVLALGDAKNDLELLRWAGIGVAMGNAVPETIDAADWMTGSNDADGVAQAIERVLPEPRADSASLRA